MVVQRPGTVYTVDDGLVYPGTLVGSGALWADDDPATYVLLPGYDGASRASTARADLDMTPFSGLGPGLSLTVKFLLADVDPDFATGVYGGGNFGITNNIDAVFAYQGGLLIDGWNTFGPFVDGVDLGPSYNMYGSVDTCVSLTNLFAFALGPSVGPAYKVLEAIIQIEAPAPDPSITGEYLGDALRFW